MASKRRKPRKKCSGHKKDGSPCGAYPIRGGTVCVSHGGGAGQVKRKARERLAIAEAQRMVALAGVDMEPLEHLLDSLYRAFQQVKVWGLMVSALDAAGDEWAAEHDEHRGALRYIEADVESDDELRVVSAEPLLGFDRHGAATLHPFVAEHRRWVEIHGKFAKQCMDANIDERILRLQERQVELVNQAFEHALDAINVSSADRQVARKAYAADLRAAA